MLAFEQFVQYRLLLVSHAPDIDSFALDSSATKYSTVTNKLTRNCFFAGRENLLARPVMCGLVSKQNFLQAQAGLSTGTEASLRG